jgi:hypothetical protein
MLYLYFLSLIAMSWIADAFFTTSQLTPTVPIRATVVKGIMPTTSGQIGVNPVLSELGDPTTYIGEIYGSDTQYITVDDASTKVGLLIHILLMARNFLHSKSSYAVSENSGLESTQNILLWRQ